MKFPVVIVCIFFCIVPWSASSRTRFVHPSLMIKFLYLMGEGSILDIAKSIIKRSYEISEYGSYIVDYGAEAVYAGFTCGPEKIPHELIKYSCAIKIASYTNDYIDLMAVRFLTEIDNHRSLKTMIRIARRFLVRWLIRIGIDLVVDAYLQEPDSSEQHDLLVDGRMLP